MSAPAVAYDVRYRIAEGDADWTVERFPLAAEIIIGGVLRGTAYEAEICAVAANGRTSAWVPCPVTVPDTNRTGALALPANVIGNQASMWDVDTSVTYASEADTEGLAQATISVSAGTLVIGSQTISYGASSAVVTGAAEEQRTVYLYYDDPRLAGGSKPLGVADNIVDSANVYGRIAITSLKITFPVAGGTGGGGGGIGGGGGGGGARDPEQQQVV